MPNTIIKASAGSGKTFRLSNEFLAVVCHDDNERTNEKISTILASTFTRKAAGEILDRILNRLAEAALNENKLEEFAKHIPLPTKNNAEQTTLLQKTTADIAKNLHRLRICTLDAFFNKIASSFALELSLPPGWTIIEETEYQRSIHEAVQEVLEASVKHNEARKLLNLLQKGEERDISREIIDLAKTLLPLVRSSDADHWDHTDSKRLGTLTHGKMTDESLQKHLAPCLSNSLNNSVSDTDWRKNILPQVADKKNKGESKPDARFESALESLLKNVQARNWEEILLKGLGNKIALGENDYYKKPIEPPLHDFVYPLVRHAQAIWSETIIHQTTATRELLDLVWEKLESILQQKRGFRFEDITFCLGNLFFRKPETLPQQLLSHRMDAPTKHLLLDEFQDTSLPQWNILKPFVQSVNKHESTTFFCVGDLKQAIYGWRGGIAEIFETVSDFLESDGAETPNTPVMAETRRNSQAIVDAVNQVFLHIGTNAAVCEKSSAAAAKWQEWFGSQPHQTLSTTKDKGYCVLEAVPNEETTETGSDDSEQDSEQKDSEQKDMESPFWKYTLDRIEQLHHKHPARSIGILFRAGKDIPTVLKGLKKRGVEASDEGGIPLTDSAAVQQVLSVMTLIDHPGDTIARFHLSNGPLAGLLPLQNYTDDFEAEKTAHCWREKLLSQGYGKTIKEFIPVLTPCDPKESQRLEKLLELAYRFDEQAAGTRTRQFIETVDAARLATPSADEVRVMTIHKAKGLEFDIVVLPDLDGKLIGMPPKVIVSRNSPTAPVNFVLRYVSKPLQFLLPEHYQKAFSQWEDDQVKESLAVLYVAMTRAKHELVMIVPEKSKKGIGTYAGVLRTGLGAAGSHSPPMEGSPAGRDSLYQNGSEDWDDGVDVNETNVHASNAAKSGLPPLVWHGLANQPVLRNLPRATPSGMELKLIFQHTETKVSEEFMEVSREDAALRGTAIHACFAQIRWLEEDKLDAKVLQRIVEQSSAGKKGKINSLEIVNDFMSMCGQPEVRKVLMRSSYPAGEEIDVERERRFAVRLRHKLLHGSIDRLVIRRLGSEVVDLEIIDFKTDQRLEGEAESEFLAERQRIYAPQIEAYCQAAGRLYPHVRSISAKLVFASVDKVAELIVVHSIPEPQS